MPNSDQFKGGTAVGVPALKLDLRIEVPEPPATRSTAREEPPPAVVPVVLDEVPPANDRTVEGGSLPDIAGSTPDVAPVAAPPEPPKYGAVTRELAALVPGAVGPDGRLTPHALQVGKDMSKEGLNPVRLKEELGLLPPADESEAPTVLNRPAPALSPRPRPGRVGAFISGLSHTQLFLLILAITAAIVVPILLCVR